MASSSGSASQPKKEVEKWVLTEVIGQGSFAKVWKAHHKETDKVAAVKEINTERLNKKLVQHAHLCYIATRVCPYARKLYM